jgi:hypothetical protein
LNEYGTHWRNIREDDLGVRFIARAAYLSGRQQLSDARIEPVVIPNPARTAVRELKA